MIWEAVCGLDKGAAAARLGGRVCEWSGRAGAGPARRPRLWGQGGGVAGGCTPWSRLPSPAFCILHMIIRQLWPGEAYPPARFARRSGSALR